MLPPFACVDSVAVVMEEPSRTSNCWPALSLMSPALPAAVPILLAAIEAWCVSATRSVAWMMMDPPVAAWLVPVVFAEIAPPFCNMSEVAFTKILPATPLPCVSVKTPLSPPAIRTAVPEFVRPSTLIAPPWPTGISPELATTRLPLKSCAPSVSCRLSVTRLSWPASPELIVLVISLLCSVSATSRLLIIKSAALADPGVAVSIIEPPVRLRRW